MTLTYLWTGTRKSLVFIPGAEYNIVYGEKKVHQKKMT